MNNKNKATVELVKLIIESNEHMYIPQANDLNKIVIIIDILKESFINENDISKAIHFHKRQTQYYADALRFLEIIDTLYYGKHTLIGLKEDMHKYFEKGSTAKLLKKYILENNFLEQYEERLTTNFTKENKIGSETYKRRKQSLDAWKRWINDK